MALRLPIPTRNVRRPSRLRSAATIGFAAVVLVVLPLRMLLAVVQIADWTTAWRTVEYLSLPFVWPIQLILPFDATLVGNLVATEVLATVIFGGLAAYTLTLLTVRRRR